MSAQVSKCDSILLRQQMVIQLDLVEKSLPCEGAHQSKQQREVGVVKGTAATNSMSTEK